MMKKLILFFCFMFSVILHGSIFLGFNQHFQQVQDFQIKSFGEVIDVKIINSEINAGDLNLIKVSNSPKLKKRSGQSGVISQAKLKGELKIIYPELSKLLKEEGEVVLAVKVNEFGMAIEVNILTSSGHERLDHYAKSKLLNSRFVAAKKYVSGQLANTEDVAILKINFKLQ